MNSPEVIEKSFALADQFMGVNLPNGTGDAVTKLIGFAAAGFGVLALKTSVKKVKANHIGLRTRRGRFYDKHENPYGCERPGIHFVVPFFSDIEIVEVREKPTTVETIIDVPTPDREVAAQKKVRVTVGWSVLDKDIEGQHAAYKTVTRISEADNAREETVQRIVGGAIRGLAEVYVDGENVTSDEEMSVFVAERSAEELASYGLGLTAVTIGILTDSEAERLGKIIASSIPRYQHVA